MVLQLQWRIALPYEFAPMEHAGLVGRAALLPLFAFELCNGPAQQRPVMLLCYELAVRLLQRPRHLAVQKVFVQ